MSKRINGSMFALCPLNFPVLKLHYYNCRWNRQDAKEEILIFVWMLYFSCLECLNGLARLEVLSDKFVKKKKTQDELSFGTHNESETSRGWENKIRTHFSTLWSPLVSRHNIVLTKRTIVKSFSRVPARFFSFFFKFKFLFLEIPPLWLDVVITLVWV